MLKEGLALLKCLPLDPFVSLTSPELSPLGLLGSRLMAAKETAAKSDQSLQMSSWIAMTACRMARSRTQHPLIMGERQGIAQKGVRTIDAQKNRN